MEFPRPPHEIIIKVIQFLPKNQVKPHLTDKSRFEPVLAHLETREFYLVYCLIC
jgi:hypothetical protein